jgi:RNA 3'-terminal phosphate cyclase (ATP)
MMADDFAFFRALEEITSARVEGDELRSNEVTFAPKHRPKPFRGVVDVQEFEKGLQPGNAVVLGQALLPILARAGGYSQFKVHGETYNTNTLTYDVFEKQTLAAYRQQGVYAWCRQLQSGFGHATHGEVEFEVEPSVMLPIDLDKRGELVSLRATITICDIAASIAERGAKLAEAELRQVFPAAEADIIEVPGSSPGVFVSVTGNFERGFGSGLAMGARGIRMETVTRTAIEQFQTWYKSGAALDPFLVDQLLLPAVLAEGDSCFTTSSLTRRVISQAWVIKQFMPVQITILGRESEPATIRISKTY